MKLIEKLKSKLFGTKDKPSNIVRLSETKNQESEPNVQRSERVKRMNKIIEENERTLKNVMALFGMMLMVAFLSVISIMTIGSHFIEARKSFDALNQAVSGLSIENEALVERVSELEGTAENEYESKKTEKIVPIDENSVYYGKTYKDLWCDYDYDDEAVALLSGISKIQYGTAGCSLQMMASGVDFIVLSQMSETQWKEIPVYLKTLTPAQLDYLSFRMLDAYHFAQSVINREGIIADIESMGIEAETYESCTEVQTIKFLSYMFTYFEENGVNYEWEEYDVLSLFN